MKITIAKEEFIRGLQSVQNVVNPRTTLPVLSNVLLEANDGKLLLTATDLDVTVSCTVKADVSEEGRVTLPAKKLFGIVVLENALKGVMESKGVMSIRQRSSLRRSGGPRSSSVSTS